MCPPLENSTGLATVTRVTQVTQAVPLRQKKEKIDIEVGACVTCVTCVTVLPSRRHGYLTFGGQFDLAVPSGVAANTFGVRY